jgi:hypothetical protein
MSEKRLKRKIIKKKLFTKNRLVILNEDTFEEIFSLRLTLMNVFVVATIGAFLIIKVTIDMYLRRNDNYDEYKWGLTPTTTIDSSSNQTTTTTSSECAQAPKPFGENQTGCYGASCCSVGTVWDETTYTCVNKPDSAR